MGGVADEHRCWPAATAPRSIWRPNTACRRSPFPAISTGIYRFPADIAARIAVGTVASELAASPRVASRSLARVIFCCFSAESAEHHKDAFGELGLV